MAKTTKPKRAPKDDARNQDGTFAKGGKRGGRRENAGRVPKNVRLAEEQLWAERPEAVNKALETLLELTDEKYSPAARFHAASKILDRVYGKARITMNINDTTHIVLAKLEPRIARTIELDVVGALPPGANDDEQDRAAGEG